MDGIADVAKAGEAEWEGFGHGFGGWTSREGLGASKLHAYDRWESTAKQGTRSYRMIPAQPFPKSI